MPELNRQAGKRALFEGVIEDSDSPEQRDKTELINSDVEKQLEKLLEALEAIRQGDLTKTLSKQSDDLFGQIADSYNATVDSLRTFSSEVSRVAKEVGTEGKLGGAS